MWIIYSFIACTCFALMFLIMKLLTNSGLSNVQILAWIYLVALTIFIVHLLGTNQTLEISKTPLLILIGAGVLSYIGNYFQVKALETAPNPGYAIAIVNIDILLLVILSAIFLNVDMSWIKLTGTVFCIIGASLLAF